jgi:hypothetical protein
MMIIVYLIFNTVILKKFKNTDSKQDDSIDGINALIDASNALAESNEKLTAAYEAMREAYEKYGETEDDRNRVIGAVMEQSAATLEILQFAYANSAKLPQGIKDVINLKYANTLKTLASDEDLIEIVKSVRTKINEGITPGEERDE